MPKTTIFAIDAGDIKIAIDYCKKLKQRQELFNDIYAIKLGLIDVLDEGLSIISRIKEKTGLPIICDLKLAEIPSIAADIAKKVYHAGADGIVVQGFVGKSVISNIQEVAPKLDIYIVSEMTHNNGGLTHAHLEDFAYMAKEQRVFGVIGPGNRPERLKYLRNNLPPECKVIAAGVSDRQHGNEKDAFQNGADLIIEGSDIRSILNKNNNNLNRWTFVSILIYAAVGLFLSLLGLYFNSTKWKFLTDRPIINVAIPTVFAIVGAFIGYLKRRK